ncbi:MAG: riboflavin biosynthesis protein RibF [Phycisphaerae bacterium]
MSASLRRYHSLAAFPRDCGTAVSIGNFDGVHLGHQAIMRAACAAASSRGLRAVVVTFDPPPAEVLFPARKIDKLTTTREKLHLLAQIGIDDCIVLPTDRSLLDQSPLEFLQHIVAHLQPEVFVEGPDFHFGKDRAGNIDTLRDYAAEFHFEVIEVPPTGVPTLPEILRASSSIVRRQLSQGNVRAASQLMARPHRITGAVGSGDGRGAKMGVATANLDNIPQMIPGVGVYATLAQLADNRVFPAAVNIGPQPTFEGDQNRVEAHIIGFTADLRDQRLALYFLDRLRDQIKFADAAALVTQIRQDMAETVQIAATQKIDSHSLLPLD